jgi:hypothetical protein
MGRKQRDVEARGAYPPPRLQNHVFSDSTYDSSAVFTR